MKTNILGLMSLITSFAAIGLTLFAPLALTEGLFQTHTVSLFQMGNNAVIIPTILVGVWFICSCINVLKSNSHKRMAVASGILFAIVQIVSIITALSYSGKQSLLGTYDSSCMKPHSVAIVAVLLTVCAIVANSIRYKQDKTDTI